ncbi:hypothetical protein [Cohnella rhizosphaerae]|uniref:Extracellular solute-binding protein n=1 Tax=Cohnella rhizosphaerae TaxID=1457232 RepID=A0A9X4KZX3_9BACL|nr:hypothetical protein [Cohnella rhizosphaerae]MDG0814007.1 hypothetical protein [Cohnella rhizosphaerae]
MIRNKRRRVAGMAAILTVAVMTGCAGSNDPKPSAASSAAASSAAATATAGASPTQASEKEPVTLKLSSDNALFMATLAPGAQHDPVMEEIRRKTGVTLELDTQTDDKKFNLMLAGGDLPDIIVLQNAPKYLKQMIEGNQVIPLDGLIEKHGQTILKESPSKIEISKRFFSNGTGQPVRHPRHREPEGAAVQVRQPCIQHPLGLLQRARVPGREQSGRSAQAARGYAAEASDERAGTKGVRHGPVVRLGTRSVRDVRPPVQPDQ